MSCKKCPKNTYSGATEPGATNATVCVPCPSTSPLSPPGSISSVQCDAQKDAVCQEGPGWRQSSSLDACVPCMLGSFGNDAKSCQLCSVGFYSDESAASTCKKCVGKNSLCNQLPGTTFASTPSTSSLQMHTDISKALAASTMVAVETERPFGKPSNYVALTSNIELLETVLLTVLILLSGVVLSLHRYFCSWCLKFDQFFKRQSVQVRSNDFSIVAINV